MGDSLGPSATSPALAELSSFCRLDFKLVADLREAHADPSHTQRSTCLWIDRIDTAGFWAIGVAYRQTVLKTSIQQMACQTAMLIFDPKERTELFMPDLCNAVLNSVQ